MTTPSVAKIAAKVRERCPALVEAWLAVVQDLGRPSLTQDELRANLRALLERTIDSLSADPPHPSEARAVGRDLAQNCGAQPELLGQTQIFLSRHLLAHLEAAERAVLQPLLAAFLGYAALGFVGEAQKERFEEGGHAHGVPQAAVQEVGDILVFVVDAQGRIVGFNSACERLSGYSFDEVYGQPHTFPLDPDDQEASRSLADRLRRLSPREHFFVPYRSVWLTRDGQRRHIEWTATALFDQDGSLTYLIGTGIDVASRRLAEQELSRAHRRVAQAREAERLRLAQELHDGAVQQLLGLSYQLAEMKRRAAESQPWSPDQRLEEIMPGLEMVRSDIIGVAQDLRRLTGYLRPPTLRELGLSHVLDAYISDWQQKLGHDAPRVTLDLAPLEDEPLPESVAICLFRLVQEALWNVHKHASASRVNVSTRCEDGAVMLRIRDDGRGFRIPSHLFQFAASGRFGFVGMEERVHAVDGLLSVWSKPGRGTEIQAYIPLRSQG